MGPEGGKEKPSSPPVSVTSHRFRADQPQRKAARHRTPGWSGLLLRPAKLIQSRAEGGQAGQLGPQAPLIPPALRTG